jgi:hypothetical protein
MPLPYYATPGTHTVANSHVLRADELSPADTIKAGEGWEVVVSTMKASDTHTLIMMDGGEFLTVPHGTLYHVSDVVELHQFVATITHPFYPGGMTMEVMAPYYRRAMELIVGGVKGVDAENWKDTVGGLSIGETHFTVPSPSIR